MKKIWILILTLAVTLACFSGCADSHTTAEPDAATAVPEPEATPTPKNTAKPVSYADSDTALIIEDKAYSLAECNIYFTGTYYDFLNTYGDYAALFGLDTSTGLSDLKNQSCEYSSDGTWYGYFMETTIMMMEQVQLLCEYADENGVQLSEEQRSSIEELFTDIDAIAQESGFEDGDAYLESIFGSGATQALYCEYLEINSLADAAYEVLYGSLSFSEQEIKEHYAQMGYDGEDNDYPVTAMRHILIMAEADENGEYSEEAIAAAHSRAEELYAQWLNGEQTEESFAALADLYTDDGGSAGNGGFYEDIYKNQMVEGINDWLFEADRAAGDTAVIDNNGSYVGTHIVYFVGKGELYSDMLSRDDLIDSAISEWFSAGIEGCRVEYGSAYDAIGIIE